MKRTLLPKLIAFALCSLCFAYLSPIAASVGSLVILLLTFLLLAWPVLSVRSSFYVPTLSRGKDRDCVSLTFDDGPDPVYTRSVLAILEAEGIQATFFLVGERLERHPELAREIVRRGHIIGNHSYSHGMDFHFQTPPRYRRELAAFNELTQRIIGEKCRYFRSPQGFRTPMLADVLTKEKLLCIGWTTRGYDSVRDQSDLILKSLRKSLKGGGIILLHDGSGLGGRASRAATLEALPQWIREVKERGLTFKRLDQLLDEPAYFPS